MFFDQYMLLCLSLDEIVVDDFVSGRAEGKRQTSRQVCQVSYTSFTVLLVSESEPNKLITCFTSRVA